MQKIKSLRKKIDKIDSNILELLNKRAEVTLDVGKAKKSEPKFSPAREMEVYDRLIKSNKGPMLNETVQAVYGEIMSAHLLYRLRLR